MSKFGIVAIDKSGKRVAYYRNQSEAKRAGYCQQVISMCLTGKRKSHRGLAWEFATPYDRFVEFDAIHLQDEANGRSIGDNELWAAYLMWVPADWTEHMKREEFRVPSGSGRFWKTAE